MSINQRISLIPVNGMPFQSATGQSLILVYKPKLDGNGQIVLDGNGGALFERIGGAPMGSSGVIVGPSVRGDRTFFHEYKNISTTPMGKDLVNVFPVQLDTYPDVGWFLADCIKSI